jgi:enoyl-CoA hydratase
MDHLLVERFEKVTRITVNRPQVRNAQSRRLLVDLDAALLAAVEDPEIRVIIIAGAGKDFSAGHDLGSPEENEDRRLHPRPKSAPGEYDHLMRMNLENCLRWRDLPKPTIAQVQGNCIMGGLMLASCCDLIVASSDAVFADRSVAWGGAHVQYFSMPWDIGARKAKEYLFTAGPITAPDAERLGLVNRVVEREALEAETLALANRIAANDPFALRLAKLSVNEALDRQGQRQALESAFKNYMLAIPHRKDIGTFGDATPLTARDRLAQRDDARTRDR